MSGRRDLSEIPDEWFTWLPRALQYVEDTGIEAAAVLTAAREPETITEDPRNGTSGWPAERRRRGDITAVVAFPPYQLPVIWGAYYHLPLLSRPPRGSGAGGGAPRGTLPTTMRELRRRLVRAGLVIVPGGRHMRVLDQDGNFVAPLSTSPSDHRAMENFAAQLAKRGINIRE